MTNKSRTRSSITGGIMELMGELLLLKSTPVLLRGTLQFIKAKWTLIAAVCYVFQTLWPSLNFNPKEIRFPSTQEETTQLARNDSWITKEQAHTSSAHTCTLTHTHPPPVKILILPDLIFSTKQVGREKRQVNTTTHLHPSPRPSCRREILEADAKMEKVAGGNGDRISVNCCN